MVGELVDANLLCLHDQWPLLMVDNCMAGTAFVCPRNTCCCEPQQASSQLSAELPTDRGSCAALPARRHAAAEQPCGAVVPPQLPAARRLLLAREL
jgi:hypothetical protein